MAFNLAQLLVTLGIDTTNFDSQLARARQSLERVRQSLSSIAAYASRAMIAAGGGVAFFVKSASDAIETVNKFKVVFADQSQAAEEFAESLSSSIRASKTDVMTFMARIQDTLVPMGMARTEARLLSQQIVELAYDLSSFNNISVREAMDRLTSGLVGNHEATRMLGIGLSQASLDQELMARGQKKVAQGATEMQKMLARLAIIVRSSKDAIGDAARTSDEFANKLRGMHARVKEMAIALGQEFLPLAERIVDGVTAMADSIGEMSKEQKQAVVSVTMFGGALLGLAVALPIIAKITAAFAAMGGPVGALVVTLGLLGAAFLTAKANGESLNDTLEKLYESMMLLTGVGDDVNILNDQTHGERQQNKQNRQAEDAMKRGKAAAEANDLAAMQAAVQQMEKAIADKRSQLRQNQDRINTRRQEAEGESVWSRRLWGVNGKSADQILQEDQGFKDANNKAQSLAREIDRLEESMISLRKELTYQQKRGELIDKAGRGMVESAMEQLRPADQGIARSERELTNLFGPDWRKKLGGSMNALGTGVSGIGSAASSGLSGLIEGLASGRESFDQLSKAAGYKRQPTWMEAFNQSLNRILQGRRNDIEGKFGGRSAMPDFVAPEQLGKAFQSALNRSAEEKRHREMLKALEGVKATAQDIWRAIMEANSRKEVAIFG